MAGYKTVVGMVNGMLEELNITVPVALHLALLGIRTLAHADDAVFLASDGADLRLQGNALVRADLNQFLGLLDINIHGKYPENWAGLSFETLDAIQQLTGEMPLVLHGEAFPTEPKISIFSFTVSLIASKPGARSFLGS